VEHLLKKTSSVFDDWTKGVEKTRLCIVGSIAVTKIYVDNSDVFKKGDRGSISEKRGKKKKGGEIREGGRGDIRVRRRTKVAGV